MAERKPTTTYEDVPLTSDDIADRSEARAATFARDPLDPGVCVADGMGLRICVERGALVVEDGLGEHRRTRRFDKATHGLSRLVVLGATGFVSIDSLHWLRRLGIGVVVLDPKGSPAFVSAPRRTDDARLRRQQALAPDEPVGCDIARFLIEHKLAGQAAILRSRFGLDDAATTVEQLAMEVADAGTIDEVRQLEAVGAETYWQSWVGCPEAAPRFASRDRSRVPKHWLTYHGRRSVLQSANGNRKAERPVNALANYLYGCLEAEATLACYAVALDAGLGLIHLDARGRQSLALDLMEPVRPEVDAYVLDLLESRTFRKVEFVESADGHVRLLPPLISELAETVAQWARSLAPYAERVAHFLGQAMAGKYEAVTPLTRGRGKAAQAAIKARKAAASQRASGSTPRQRPAGHRPQPPSWSCPDCGGAVTDRHRVRCDACVAKDPRQTPEVRAKRAAAISARRQAEAAWEGVGMDPDFFRSTVLPTLATVKLSAIVEACGVAKGSASNWRTGKRTPHPSHWPALAELTGIGRPT